MADNRQTKIDILQKLGFEDKIEPEEKLGCRIETSSIHGKGLFATEDIESDSVITHFAAFVPGIPGIDLYHSWEISEVARYTNHSSKPNAVVTSDENNLTMVASSFIGSGDEILLDYFQGSDAMGPGTQLTYKGEPQRIVTPEEINQWSADME
jgi:hypothetical protein